MWLDWELFYSYKKNQQEISAYCVPFWEKLVSYFFTFVTENDFRVMDLVSRKSSWNG